MNMKLALLVSSALLVPTSGFSAAQSWSEMNDSVVRMYQNGSYTQAVTVAEESLRLAKKKFEPESPEVALALLYKTQGRYSEAVALYEQSLAIAEKIAGPNDEDLMVPLNNLAMLYETESRQDKADAIYERLKKSGFKKEAALIEKRGDKADRR